MNYISTRGGTPPCTLDRALNAGLAPDGGLFVPTHLPRFQLSDFDPARTLPEVATVLLAPFFAGSHLQDALPAIAQESLDPAIELRPLDQSLGVMELFHGPTAAFKDFAARFLAACMSRLRAPDAPVTTVLVATSGDTGAAVAAAFHRRPGFRVVVLYPDGRVSPRQAHHLGAFGDNVSAYAVQGSFDDCQALVKRAFADQELRRRLDLASANSISLGRLLPQIAYYAWASLTLVRAGQPAPHWIIPSGNLGNGLAAILAREMGLPCSGITLATNANPSLHEFFAGGDYRGRASVATLANAMDVGAPSNFERLNHFLDPRTARENIQCVLVDDALIRKTICDYAEIEHYISCPHTACALSVARELRAHGKSALWAVATAHPAKFPEVVEALVGETVTPPAAIASMLASHSAAQPLAQDYAALCVELAGTQA